MSYPWFKEEIIVHDQEVDLSMFGLEGPQLVVRREDRIHPFVSGNKLRKLKYNLKMAMELKHSTLLTYGGAYSNHIAAVASVGAYIGVKTIGVIRGEELGSKIDANPTLRFARDCGMRFHFVSRDQYKEKDNAYNRDQLELLYGPFYEIPEGGTNTLAVEGCKEILSKADSSFTDICVSVGTGGTISGLINASKNHQRILGFSALKGAFQNKEIEKYAIATNYQLTDDYCFGGYAKIDEELVRFINTFKERTGIPLDPIYTGKMMYGIFDLIKNRKIKENSRILAIHTGGLQGIAGMNQLLKRRNLPEIHL